MLLRKLKCALQGLALSGGYEIRKAHPEAYEGVRTLQPFALALAVGRPKDRARVVYLVELSDFDRDTFSGILSRHGLKERWMDWATALGLDV